jgi:vitamin B12 transporter
LFGAIMMDKIRPNLTSLLRGLAVSPLFLLSVPVQAEPLVSVDELVITATGVATPAREIGASLDVITREDLERQQVVYLQDALKQLRGMHFSQEGGPGGAGFLRMRGLTRQNMVILIDGNNMADAADLNGGAEIAHILTADIERVEVIRGGNSVLYGSNAVAGVVNIITRKPSEETSVETSLALGSHRLREATAQISGRSENGRIGYRVSAQSLDVESPSDFDEENTIYIENEDYENLTLSAAIDMALTDKTTASFLARGVRASLNTDGYSDMGVALDGHFGIDTQQNLLSAALETSVSEQLNISAKYSFFGNYRDTFAEVGQTYWYDGERESVEARAAYFFNGTDYLNLGIENKTETLLQNGLSAEKQVDTQSAFALLHTQTGELSTSFGLRNDDHDKFGGQTSWRFGATYPVTDLVLLTTSAGTAYRAPSLYELFGEDAYCVDTLCGNEALLPEETDSWDVGLRVVSARFPATWEVSYFDIQTTNRIFYESTGEPLYLGKYQNDVGESRSSGTELSVDVPVSPRLQIGFVATHVNPRDANGGIQDSQPRQLYSANIGYRAADGQSHWGLTALQAKDRYRRGVLQEDYLVLGANYNTVVGENMKLEVQIDNLLDEHYRTSTLKSTPRRRLKIGLRARF